MPPNSETELFDDRIANKRSRDKLDSAAVLRLYCETRNAAVYGPFAFVSKLTRFETRLAVCGLAVLKRAFSAIIRIMSTRTTLTLAVAAGFFGGIVSQRIVLTPVFAQAPTPAAKEIRAEKFVIVDVNGLPRGAFGIDKKDGWPTIEITDAKGHLQWVRWGEPFLGKGKSSLVPKQ